MEELVRHAYEEAWNNGDFDTLLAIAHEEIVFRTSGALPDLEAEYRGRAGMRRFIETFRAPWDQIEIEVEKVIERGEDVLVLLRFRAEGRDGLSVDARFGQVGRLRDGLVVSLIAYPDWTSAAEAVGVDLDA